MAIDLVAEIDKIVVEILRSHQEMMNEYQVDERGEEEEQTRDEDQVDSEVVVEPVMEDKTGDQAQVEEKEVEVIAEILDAGKIDKEEEIDDVKKKRRGRRKWRRVFQWCVCWKRRSRSAWREGAGGGGWERGGMKESEMTNGADATACPRVLADSRIAGNISLTYKESKPHTRWEGSAP